MEYDKRCEKAVRGQGRGPAMRSYLRWLENLGIVMTAGEVLDEAALRKEVNNLRMRRDDLKKKYGGKSANLVC